jgi:hypothetical protein
MMEMYGLGFVPLACEWIEKKKGLLAMYTLHYLLILFFLPAVPLSRTQRFTSSI